MIEKVLKMNNFNNNELFLSYCSSIILCLSLERVYKVFNSETCNDAPPHPGWGVFSFLHLTNSCKRALWPVGHGTTATTTRLQPMDRYSSLPLGDLQHFSRKAYHQPESLPHSSHIRSHLRRQIRNLGLAAQGSGCNFFLQTPTLLCHEFEGKGPVIYKYIYGPRKGAPQRICLEKIHQISHILRQKPLKYIAIL
jgi:hypothetical protein